MRRELLVKQFQSRQDSLVFDHGRKIRENAKRENFKTSPERQVTKSDYFYFKVVFQMVASETSEIVSL